MAEGTYEYECMRAELLGVSKPDYEEFLQRKQEEPAPNPEGESGENEETTNETPSPDERNNDQKAAGSKLEEFSNMISPVVSITQKKIDSFKIRCGSVSDMIKTKIVSISGTSSTNTDGADAKEVSNNEVDAKKQEET